ncbi:ANTAR domain-containing protein [Streptomyces bobili]|uniref:ANTAR domain-containing protein n=1 Tax=Streptomyces bobili TaxID=67280 RepID=UPI0033BD5010
MHTCRGLLEVDAAVIVGGGRGTLQTMAATEDGAAFIELVAQALADSAALSLMHWSTEPARVDDVITRVQSTLAAKAALEIAKGMIAVYGHAEVGEAGRRLTDYARHHRVSLADTAHALVSRTMDPTVIVGDPHGS